MTTKKFETGRTYSMRWIGDADLESQITILRRTDQYVWIKNMNGREVRRRIFGYEDAEQIRPYGNYSMAPFLDAGKVVA